MSSVAAAVRRRLLAGFRQHLPPATFIDECCKQEKETAVRTPRAAENPPEKGIERASDNPPEKGIERAADNPPENGIGSSLEHYHHRFGGGGKEYISTPLEPEHIVDAGALDLLKRHGTGFRDQVGVMGNLVQSSPNSKKEVGALQPLIGLLSCLESQNGSLQHNAAFALYGLADNEDNVADLIKVGGVQKPQDGDSIVQIITSGVVKPKFLPLSGLKVENAWLNKNTCLHSSEYPLSASGQVLTPAVQTPGQSPNPPEEEELYRLAIRLKKPSRLLNRFKKVHKHTRKNIQWGSDEWKNKDYRLFGFWRYKKGPKHSMQQEEYDRDLESKYKARIYGSFPIEECVHEWIKHGRQMKWEQVKYFTMMVFQYKKVIKDIINVIEGYKKELGKNAKVVNYLGQDWIEIDKGEILHEKLSNRLGSKVQFVLHQDVEGHYYLAEIHIIMNEYLERRDSPRLICTATHRWPKEKKDEEKKGEEKEATEDDLLNAKLLI